MPIKIALAGNPNSGKTTMFNALTGGNEKVGNWAGVTVDKKERTVKKNFSGKTEIVDEVNSDHQSHHQFWLSGVFSKIVLPNPQ